MSNEKMLFSRTVSTPFGTAVHLNSQYFFLPQWISGSYSILLGWWVSLHGTWSELMRGLGSCTPTSKLIGQIRHDELCRSLLSGVALKFNSIWAGPPLEDIVVIPHEKICVLSLVLKTKSRKVVFAHNMLSMSSLLKIYREMSKRNTGNTFVMNWKNCWALR